MTLFHKTKKLVLKVDEYLDALSESALLFDDGVKMYLSNQRDRFEDQVRKMKSLEKRADELRRSIEQQLYRETLIPESRGDVLALLETADNVINQAKATLLEFSVEIPKIPTEFHEDFGTLTQNSVAAVEAMTKALRAFFKNPSAVRDSTHKVYFYEKEADTSAENLKRAVFINEDLKLSEKIHLRYFALHIDTIADKAEDVADRLTIYTIKRSV